MGALFISVVLMISNINQRPIKVSMERNNGSQQQEHQQRKEETVSPSRKHVDAEQCVSLPLSMTADIKP